MPTFLYRCPVTGQNVQAWIAEATDQDTHYSFSCLACSRVHLISPSTGKVVGGDEDAD